MYLEQKSFQKIAKRSAEKAAVLFGIFGIVEKQEALLLDDIQALIDERLEARKAKNLLSDEFVIY